MSVLEIENLRVELTSTGDYIIDDFSLSAESGRIVAIVGESGSGKTTTGTALLGYARRGARIAGGSVRIAGTQVVPGTDATLRGQRGRLVSYIHQDPSMALNPALRIGPQIAETLAAHEPAMSRTARDARVGALLRDVRLPDTPEFRARFPHQLSGGQLQRICMAMAIACKPRVLVLDEPTTGLDVTTQAHVLETLQRLVREHDMVAIYVTHDLSVVSEIADSVIVMYSGLICEQGSRDAVFGNPAHPYTRRLLAAVPDLGTPRQLEVIAGAAPSPSARPTGCSFAPRCRLATEACVAAQPGASEVAPGHLIRCIRPEAAAQIPLGCAAAPQPAPAQPHRVLTVRNLRVAYGQHTVLHDVSFDLNRGECLAVVGESGSGKTTLSRTLVGLVQPVAGTVHFKGTALPGDVSRTPETVRREMQYVFQSAFTALNPRRTVEASLTTPLRHFFGHRGAPARERILRALDKVALSPRVLALYPGQLSGGERQRVAIARALVCEPEVLLCDEITSALDVSVQAAIVELLQELRRGGDLSLLFVTHDLGLVRTIADRVLVLNQGEIVEAGPTGEVIDHPQDDYTRLLMGNTPRLDLPAMAQGRAASA